MVAGLGCLGGLRGTCHLVATSAGTETLSMKLVGCDFGEYLTGDPVTEMLAAKLAASESRFDLANGSCAHQRKNCHDFRYGYEFVGL